ncbi:hypothetical protein K505DRAFT_970 [Melanomma pulvis-pyrius CBS 109.77]|uniref:Rhodopsin domain-containing protein n=1 Tax=Melanomma pulvis-pyrius CBS 109.77 TaxID=1314802 RepID=A0A6A6XWP8_9PLEO|nr:hypothetical protein K505DRAFT_970 [Melanomma pulvis-pyrius CBS 109.77]
MSQAVTAPSPGATIAAGTVFPVVCAILVAARFQAKRYLGSGLLIDDWLTLPALLCTAGMGISLVVGVVYKGLGYPTPQSPDPSNRPLFISPQTVTTRKVEFSMELLQFPALTCTKLSLLFFYRRVFCSPWRAFLRLLFSAMITLCIIWGLGFYFSMAFICGTHFSAYWTSVKELRTHCPHLHTQQTWLAISDSIIDGIIFVIPIPLVFRLQMTISRKLAILVVFLFAAVTVAASITRMVIWLRAIENLKKSYALGGYDNQTVTAGLYWTMFETGLGLIVVCLPPLYVCSRAIWKSHFKNDASRFNHPNIIVQTSSSLADPMGSFVDAISSFQSQSQMVNVGDPEKGVEVPLGRTLHPVWRRQ